MEYNIFLIHLVFMMLGPFVVFGTVEQDLAKRNGEFALDMYKELASETDGNIFFSPMSISLAMAMVYLGAKENTATELAQALKFKDFNELHGTFKNLLVPLEGNGDFDLEIANRLFSRKGYSPNADYVSEAENFYSAGLQELDFIGDAEGSRTIINKWVESKTNDKIKDLLPAGVINKDTILVLINAIYFKGTWKLQFNQSLTELGDFHQGTNDAIKLSMMTMEKATTFNHFKSEELKAALIALPYEGDALEMVVVLPDTNDGLSHLESTLTMDLLRTALNNMDETIITEIKIPKFKLLQAANLVERLKELGISDLFDSQKSNLKGIGENLFMSDIVHKAYIDVNEEGTEAAASTGGVVSTTSAKPMANFIADHPFMFFIRDQFTNNILFMGRLKGTPAENGDVIGEALGPGPDSSDALSLIPCFGLLPFILLFQSLILKR